MNNKMLIYLYYNNDSLYIGMRKNINEKFISAKCSSEQLTRISPKKISRIRENEEFMLIETPFMDFLIYDHERVFEEYKNHSFVKNIINYYESLNSKNTSKKVKRQNVFSDKQKIVAAALALAALGSTFTLIHPKSVYDVPTSDSSIVETTNEIAYSTTDVEETLSQIKPKETTTKVETTAEVPSTTEVPTTTEVSTTKETTTTKKETTTEEQTKNQGYGVSGYHYKNDPADGFIVTTGNKKYSISDSDYDLMCAVVMHEGGENPNEALAVASVMLNRCDSGGWGGTTPRAVITAPNQFESYFAGYYTKYLNGKAPDSVKMAVTDALNGVRNNEYESFRADFCTSYSDNMITSNGNRYK